MDIKLITERVALHHASRGNQVVRKDKDLMNDTGGTSKGRDREPHNKPPRDDVKKRYKTKRKTEKDPDIDTKPDPDMKKSSVHPLDRKSTADGWGDFNFPEENFYRRVWANLCDIVAETRGISEKDHVRQSDIHADIDQFLRQGEVMEVVARFDNMHRPEFCAECLYSRMEFED